MSRWTPVFALAALISACSATPHAADPTAERQRLLQVDAEFSRSSVARGMSAAFDAYLADDAVKLDAGQPPVHGRAAIVEALRDDPAGPAPVLAWTPEDGAASGDLGYTWGHFTFTIPASSTSSATSAPRVLKGKYMTVWRRGADGTWKAIADMGNSDPK